MIQALLTSLLLIVHAQPGAARAEAQVNLPHVAYGRTQFLPEATKAWFARYHLLQRRAPVDPDHATFRLSEDVFGESTLALLLEKAREGLERSSSCSMPAAALTSPTACLAARAPSASLAKAGGQVKVFNPLVSGGDHPVSAGVRPPEDLPRRRPLLHHGRAQLRAGSISWMKTICPAPFTT